MYALIRTLPKYSYSRFVLSNTIRVKEERIKALKNFLDSTR